MRKLVDASEPGADGLQQILITGVGGSDGARSGECAGGQADAGRGGGAAGGAGCSTWRRGRKIDLLDAMPAGVDAEASRLSHPRGNSENEAARVDYLADVVSACKE